MWKKTVLVASPFVLFLIWVILFEVKGTLVWVGFGIATFLTVGLGLAVFLAWLGRPEKGQE